MERLVHLGISTLILLGCSILPIFLILICHSRYGLIHREWFEKHAKPVGIIVWLQIYLVITPAVEEIMFRAPLILFFSSLAKIVWAVIFASSLVFGLLHATKNWFNQGNLSGIPGIVMDSLGWRVWRFSTTTTLGFILAHQAVLHQSLYRCFWIHLCWNVVFMLMVPLFLRFVILLWFRFCQIDWRRNGQRTNHP